MANLVPATVGSVSGLATVLVGAPWWVPVLCLVLALLVTTVQVIFPQDSTDRLAWWTDRRAHKQRRRSGQ
ncbi:hypothetical protein [Streptomyces phaeochromogenes]|uniref:hypothetical protein n=1 Tax=Streptomyces phaeochromogenes TaxID=1923 RepID=UPI0037192A18